MRVASVTFLEYSEYFGFDPWTRVSARHKNAIKDGHDVRYLLTEAVYNYITEMHFYEN